MQTPTNTFSPNAPLGSKFGLNPQPTTSLPATNLVSSYSQPTVLPPPTILQQGQVYTQPSFTTTTSTLSPTTSFAAPGTIYSTPTTGLQQPALYNGNTFTPAPGLLGQQAGGDIGLGKTGVAELELKKRLLDNNHETQLKYADMESDKQHKLEDKAEKQRVKAAKWKGKHVEFLVKSHENKAVKLEQRAHTHQMRAEDYKAVAKTIETERKAYDPPQEKKDDKKPGDKNIKKADDKKPALDTTKKEAPKSADTDSSKAPQQQSQQPQLQQTPTQQQDTASKYQQDVSTAAIKNAQATQWQQQSQPIVGQPSQ